MSLPTKWLYWPKWLLDKVGLDILVIGRGGWLFDKMGLDEVAIGQSGHWTNWSWMNWQWTRWVWPPQVVSSNIPNYLMRACMSLMIMEQANPLRYVRCAPCMRYRFAVIFVKIFPATFF